MLLLIAIAMGWDRQSSKAPAGATEKTDGSLYSFAPYGADVQTGQFPTVSPWAAAVRYSAASNGF